MITALLVVAQIAAAAPPDSTYATDALREIVSRAATANRMTPERLAAYRASIESELSLILRDSLGRERAGQLEQVAGTAAWNRRSGYEVHVSGYRSQSLGIPFSALTIVRGWTVPMLYGERLLLGIEGSGSSMRIVKRGSRTDTIVAIHPLARDRDRFYRYTGGDTIAVINPGGRSIPIVRVQVHPRFEVDTRFSAFDGEVDLDASRNEIVRMRGRFLERTESDSASRPLVVRVTGLVAVAYVEFVNAEVNGRYWLPAMQRIEFQAGMAALGDVRSVFRVVSRFGMYSLDDTTDLSGIAPTFVSGRRRTTFAPSDSLSAYSDWRFDIGALTSSVRADDFDDVAPRAWRTDGPPRLSFFPTRTSQVFRFNRVEGLYTGAMATLDFRDAAPGLVVTSQLGWAWTERTVRGGFAVSRTRGRTTPGLRFERTLESTNDFPIDLAEADGSLDAMIGSIDDFDYVDRRRAITWVRRSLGRQEAGLVTLQLGAARDVTEPARLTRGWVPGPSPFRPNRMARTGSYALVGADLELHPNVTGDFLQPGFGARVKYEGGIGQLDWNRVEVMGSSRKYLGAFSIGFRVDAGAVFSSNPPPQTLFELGGTERLPGYDYKEFVGDRAVLARSFASFALPIHRAPYRIGRAFVPGIAPAIAASVQGGWTQLSTAAARASARDLGLTSSGDPISRETGRARATIGAGLTFFSGLIHAGASRSIDRGARWRWAFGFGPTF